MSIISRPPTPPRDESPEGREARAMQQKNDPTLRSRFIGSIDQGTTSSRFLIFDATGNLIASHQLEFEQIHEHPGWHEQDPAELLRTVEICIEGATAKFLELGHEKDDIKTIGLTNQRETTIVWDWETGEPLRNAITWPDTRTGSIVRELKAKSPKDKDALLEQTGLPLSTYPSSVKLVWLLRNDPKVKEAYDAGRLAFGTVDTWLLWSLNGGKKNEVFVTDTSNASRTMFMNLAKAEYDDELFEFFDIDRTKLRLPKIVPSSSETEFGKLAYGALEGTRITGCLGDQSAALVGQRGFTAGTAKNTYGTGCFMLYNVGDKPVISKHGLLATVAFDFGKPMYALEGSVAVAGSGVKFLMNNLGFFRDSHRISEVAASVPDNGGCYFVTAFSGLFAPYWIDDAQGTIFGLTQHSQRGHIARATLEATCFQTKAILEAMEKDSGHKLKDLAVDGGMSNSNICMQTQADIIQIPVDRPSMHETTALGAAIAAGFAVKIWRDFEELKDLNANDRTQFHPVISQEKSAKMFGKWSRAVEMCRGWTDHEDPGLG